MKKYQLRIWYGGTYEDRTVFADYFSSKRNDGTPCEFYSFFIKDELVSSWPICRTAITEIKR